MTSGSSETPSNVDLGPTWDQAHAAFDVSPTTRAIRTRDIGHGDAYGQDEEEFERAWEREKARERQVAEAHRPLSAMIGQRTAQLELPAPDPVTQAINRNFNKTIPITYYGE